MTTFGKPGNFDPVNLSLTPTPETPAGGLTAAEMLRKQAAAIVAMSLCSPTHDRMGEARCDDCNFEGESASWLMQPLLDETLAAAVVQARAEGRARIEAVRRLCAKVIDVHAEVEMDAPEDKALHARAIETFRAALTAATEDGDPT